MAWLTRRRAVALLVAAAVLTVAVGGGAATPIAAPAAAHMPQRMSLAANAIQVSPTGPGAILLQLAARDVGGILLQLQDGVTGCLVKSTEQCAIRITDLLANP